MRLGTRIIKMADEANVRFLESKVALERRELNNLRSGLYSMMRMLPQNLKEITEIVETGEHFMNNCMASRETRHSWSGKQLV